MAKVLLKKSSVSSNAPGIGDLAYGELAINYADGRLYYKNSSNQIKNFLDSDLIVSKINENTPSLDAVTNSGSTTTNSIQVGNLTATGSVSLSGLQYPSTDGGQAGYVLTTNGSGVLSFSNVEAEGISYPTGDYGTVDSASTGTDPFGQTIVGLGFAYDCLQLPQYFFSTYDLGAVS